MTPPDSKRCQAEKTAAYSFMTLGGRVGDMIRCANPPTVIVTERKPGRDGKRGSMSLCAECLAVFTVKMPKNYATVAEVTHE